MIPLYFLFDNIDVEKTPSDKANFQPPNTNFLHSHHKCLCILPATNKNLHVTFVKTYTSGSDLFMTVAEIMGNILFALSSFHWSR